MRVRLSSTAIGRLLGAAFGMLGMTIAAVWQSEMLVIPGVWAGIAAAVIIAAAVGGPAGRMITRGGRPDAVLWGIGLAF